MGLFFLIQNFCIGKRLRVLIMIRVKLTNIHNIGRNSAINKYIIIVHDRLINESLVSHVLFDVVTLIYEQTNQDFRRFQTGNRI